MDFEGERISTHGKFSLNFRSGTEREKWSVCWESNDDFEQSGNLTIQTISWNETEFKLGEGGVRG